DRRHPQPRSQNRLAFRKDISRQRTIAPRRVRSLRGRPISKPAHTKSHCKPKRLAETQLLESGANATPSCWRDFAANVPSIALRKLDGSSVHRHHDTRSLDDGVRFGADFQAETFHRVECDDRDNLESGRKLDRDFGVDSAHFNFTNG